MCDENVDVEKNTLVARYLELTGATPREYRGQFAKYVQNDIEVLRELVDTAENQVRATADSLKAARATWEKSEAERRCLISADFDTVYAWLDAALKKHFINGDTYAFQPFYRMSDDNPANDLLIIICVFVAEERNNWRNAVASLRDQYSSEPGLIHDYLYTLARKLLV